LENETNPALGIYSDFIAAQGGNAGLLGGASAPHTSWTEVYDGSSQGAGSYTIDPGALAPDNDQGLFSVYFDFYDGDPGNSGNYLSSSSVQTSFEVDSEASSVPEPGTLSLFFCASMIFAAALLWRRMTSAS
jgi:hypothetical protein